MEVGRLTLRVDGSHIWVGNLTLMDSMLSTFLDLGGGEWSFVECLDFNFEVGLIFANLTFRLEILEEAVLEASFFPFFFSFSFFFFFFFFWLLIFAASFFSSRAFLCLNLSRTSPCSSRGGGCLLQLLFDLEEGSCHRRQ